MTKTLHWLCLTLLVLGESGCPPAQVQPTCGWTQWGHDAAHGGQACATGQRLSRALAQVTFDPFTQQEQAENDEGDLLAHFQAPLTLGDDVYMEEKGGHYRSCEDLPDGSRGLSDGGPCGPAAWSSMTWSEVHFVWKNGGLSRDWVFTSDWLPAPSALTTWEPVFHPALHGAFLYVPGLGGTLHKLDRKTGVEVKRINPRAAIGSSQVLDPRVYVAGPLTVDERGRVLYHLLWLDENARPLDGDGRGWLVRVSVDDSVEAVAFSSLVPQAPASDAECPIHFSRARYPLPFPPFDADSGSFFPTPQSTCGSQRPGLNVAPAIGADGTIYTVSRAHRASLVSYVVALNDDLTPKWASSLRDVLRDGCGQVVPADATCPRASTPTPLSHCCQAAAAGVDPSTNQYPAGEVVDSSSSSPVVLPDGTVLYGALTNYNTLRGHLFRFSANGTALATFDFGWDVTPAVWPHEGTFSIITKNNHYFLNYNDFSSGPFYISALAPDFSTQWNYASTNTQDCSRAADGGLRCTDQTCQPSADGGMSCQLSHPNGFEWCVNAPAVDPNGVVFANSEDGRVYALDVDGGVRDSLFLVESLGAAYTPIVLDGEGRIYSLNGGVMTVVGN